MNTVQQFKRLSIEKLKQKENSKSWSVLEYIEHLNKYGRFYIPENKKTAKKFKTSKI